MACKKIGNYWFNWCTGDTSWKPCQYKHLSQQGGRRFWTLCCIMTRNNKRNIPPCFLFLFLPFCSSKLSTFPRSHSAWLPEGWQSHTAVIHNCSYLHLFDLSFHFTVIFVGKQVLIQVCLENLGMAISWEPEMFQPRCPSQ